MTHALKGFGNPTDFACMAGLLPGAEVVKAMLKEQAMDPFEGTTDSEAPRRRMRIGLQAALGLFASIVLLTVSVQLARADEATSPAVPATPETSRVPTPIVPAEVDGEIVSAPRVEDPRADAHNGVVVLNTRGYNYGPNRPVAQPQLAPGTDPGADSSVDPAE